MPFSLIIFAIILTYIWVFEPTATGAARAVPVFAVLGLALEKGRRSGDVGLQRNAFAGAAMKAAWTTALAVGIVLAAGEALDTLHPRRAVGRSLALLTLWGGSQQFVLQTVVLREASELMTRRTAIIVAAALFGAVHLPNPFLASLTFAAALVWCWIYSLHPNIIPLAISHALGTEAVLHAFTDDVTGRLRIGAAYLELAVDAD